MRRESVMAAASYRVCRLVLRGGPVSTLETYSDRPACASCLPRYQVGVGQADLGASSRPHGYLLPPPEFAALRGRTNALDFPL